MSKKSLHIAVTVSFMSICWSESVFASGILDCNKIVTECVKRVRARDDEFCNAFTANPTPGSGMKAEKNAKSHCKSLSNRDPEGICEKACQVQFMERGGGHCLSGTSCESTVR